NTQQAGQRLLDQLADFPGPALLVGIVLELAADGDGVEGLAVDGRIDLRVDDVAAGNRAGAGDDRQKPGMVRRKYGDFGDALETARADGRGEPATFALGAPDEAGVGDLARKIDAQPIGRIVAGEVGLAFRLGPVGERGGKFGLGRGNAPVAADLAVAAGQERLGLVVEGAEKLALPAV